MIATRALAGLVCLLVLKLAVATPSAALTQEIGAADAEALELFEAVCLARLPGFESVEDGFAAAGLAATPQGFWADDGRGLIGRVTREERQRACFLAIGGADVAALDAVLGPALGDAMGEAQVGVVRGPRATDPALYIVDRGGWRETAVVAHVSRGYAMLTVGVDVAEGATAPWEAP